MKKLWPILLLLVPLAVVAQKKPTIKQLKNELQKVEKQKDKAQGDLDQVNEVIRDVRTDITEADTRLETAENQLEQTAEKLQLAEQRQKELSDSLVAAEDELAAQQTQVKARLRAMYMRGQETTLSALIGLANSGDLASRQFVLDRIAKNDRKLFQQYVEKRDLIETEKKEQDTLVASISQMVDSQKQTQIDLEKAREEKVKLMDSLKDRQDEMEKIVKQFDEDSKGIENQLNERLQTALESGKDLPPIGDGKFGPPAAGRTTSSFGMRYHPILHYNRMHNGIDFGGGYGAPVYATGDGLVISTSRLGGYGNAIIIEHGGGLSSVYGHLSRIMVESGATVRRGQRIGSIGSSGLSTGPHLHFEIRKNGQPVNPSRYL